MTATEQVQTLRLALDNQQQQIKQLVDRLQQSSHNLRGHLGILVTVASLLQQPLKDDDREKFLEMLSRNMRSADHVLNQLLTHTQQEGDKPTLQ